MRQTSELSLIPDLTSYSYSCHQLQGDSKLGLPLSVFGWAVGAYVCVCVWEGRFQFGVQLWVDESISLYNQGQMFCLAIQYCKLIWKKFNVK